MVRESCVVHPAKARIVLYRDWQFDVCGGDPVGAALLNFFEYWHNIKLANQPQAKAYNNVAEARGDGRPQPETLYQWHTEAEIIHGLVGMAGKDKIRSAINKIVDLGFVTVHKNPNPRFSFDKTKHFLFHPDRVNKYLKELETLENSDQRYSADRSAETRHIDQRNIGDDGRNIAHDQRNIGEQYQRLHSLTTSNEEIKDPYKSPSATAAPPNPEPLLSSLRESEKTFEEAMSGELEATLPLLFSQPGVAVYSTSPEKVTKKPKAKKAAGYVAGFEDVFWPVVVHKTNKQGALAKWAKTEGIDPQVVKDEYLRQLNAHLKLGKDAQYFRRPETWLNQRGWEDELVDPNAVATFSLSAQQAPQNLDPWTMLPIPLRRAYMLDDKRRGLTEEEFNRNQREQQVIWFAENGFPELSQKLALKLP